jgi:hypothetical protein
MRSSDFDNGILFKQGFHVAFNARLDVALISKRRVCSYSDSERLGET